jgi:hypothetical protein
MLIQITKNCLKYSETKNKNGLFLIFMQQKGKNIEEFKDYPFNN